MIAPDLLQAITGSTKDNAEKFATPLAEGFALAAINNDARLAAFLAQIGHESGSLRYVREVWGPTPAQQRYEGRADLGNTEAGDGYRYRGRGLIQTTGRFNYGRVRDRLRRHIPNCPDFEAFPEMLEEPRWAALSACDYWDMRNLNALADAGDFEAITRKINGGLNGQEDRLRRWERAKGLLAVHDEETIVTSFDGPDWPPFAPPAIAPAPTTAPQPQEKPMVAPVIGMFGKAALAAVIDAVPELLKKYSSGSAAAERNIGAANVILDVAKTSIQAANEQEIADKMAADPVAREAVRQAVKERWYEIEMAEAGGGGIAAARKADADAMNSGAPWWAILRSPSFVVACLLLPLVYLIVLSIIGLAGSVDWSPDVRAAIAGTIVGSIVGGLVGYYYGQTTSRNRTPA